MKHLIFQRNRGDDYSAPDLIREYVAEARNENTKIVRGGYGEPLLKAPGGCYRFKNERIEKLVGKVDRITITLQEVD